MIYRYNGIPNSNKNNSKEGTTDTSNITDDSQKHPAKGRKSDMKHLSILIPFI